MRHLAAGAVCMIFLGGSGPADLPGAVTDDMYVTTKPAEVSLGRLLFWDPVLSGNRNISCGTCHNPKFGTSDGVSLDLGEGGVGLGPDRVADPKDMPEQRVPRNAPGLWNLGAKQFTEMFLDGRIEVDPTHKAGFRTPIEDDMVTGFSGVLSAQAMFPVAAQDEMAGHYSENDVSQATREGRITGPGGVWDILAKRVSAIPQYRQMFDKAYPEIAAGRPIEFTDISNAIAAFIAYEWRSDDSPFDRYLRDQAALPAEATAGMELFYGKAGCSTCHSGPFQSDQKFHAMGVPQFGPGKKARFEVGNDRDLGRFRVTNDPQDRFAFRTPSLRNVTLTAPYGHDGAYRTLDGFLRAHLDPVSALENYDRSQAILPKLDVTDWTVMDDPAQVHEIAAAVKVQPVHLTEAEISELEAFLGALTGDTARTGRLGVPQTAPSGLPVDR